MYIGVCGNYVARMNVFPHAAIYERASVWVWSVSNAQPRTSSVKYSFVKVVCCFLEKKNLFQALERVLRVIRIACVNVSAIFVFHLGCTQNQRKENSKLLERIGY